MSVEQLLGERCHEAGFLLTERQRSQFLLYLAELGRWNAKLNLTAIRDDEGIIEKLFIPSLFYRHAFQIEEAGEVLDLGSGAGFPGIPLKIVFSSLSLTLLEASQKKVSFLKQICRILGFSDVSCVWGRAEAFSEGRGRFDLVLARGVGKLSKVVSIAFPLLKVGGSLIVQKGESLQQEISEASRIIERLAGKVVKIIPVPCIDGHRYQLVVVGKCK